MDQTFSIKIFSLLYLSKELLYFFRLTFDSCLNKIWFFERRARRHRTNVRYQTCQNQRLIDLEKKLKNDYEDEWTILGVAGLCQKLKTNQGAFGFHSTDDNTMIRNLDKLTESDPCCRFSKTSRQKRLSEFNLLLCFLSWV